MHTFLSKYVRFLTPEAVRRHKTDDAAGVRAGAARAVPVGFAILVLTGLVPPPAGAADRERQSIEAIASTAENFLAARSGKGDPRITLQAAQLDPRLNLAPCSRPLEGFLRRGTEIRSRTVVGVRCSGETPWKIYVPVDLIVSDSVLVAARTLPGGEVPGPGDVRIEQRDVSRLVGGYLSDPEELAGLRLKNQVHAGRVITPAMLLADKVIKRGQTVTLLAKDERVNIRMSGRALMDGAMNQRIRVENSVSKRVVEGLVRSPEHVEILINR